jgi:hypothetical protein
MHVHGLITMTAGALQLVAAEASVPKEHSTLGHDSVSGEDYVSTPTSTKGMLEGELLAGSSRLLKRNANAIGDAGGGKEGDDLFKKLIGDIGNFSPGRQEVEKKLTTSVLHMGRTIMRGADGAFGTEEQLLAAGRVLHGIVHKAANEGKIISEEHAALLEKASSHIESLREIARGPDFLL